MSISYTPALEQIVHQPNYRAWACGTFRAEVTRKSSKKWSFRVWHVLGGQTTAYGHGHGLRAVTDKAVDLLTALAHGTLHKWKPEAFK